MKKTFLLLLATLSTAVSASAQWLYKVSGDSLPKPSYIVATHSLLNPMGVVSQMDSLNEAMTNTDQMYLDVNSSAYTSALAESSKLPAGKTLTQLLTPAQNKLMDDFLKKYTEVSWKSPYNQKRYNDKMPLAVLKDFEKLLFVANHMGEYDPTHSFAQYFEAQAKKNGEMVYGLQSIDNYVDRLKNTPLTDQVKALVTFLENQQAQLTRIDKVLSAYESKDMETVAALSSDDNLRKVMTPWPQKMVEAMKEKPTLFVLPCETLGGAGGILSSLKDLGLQVTPL